MELQDIQEKINNLLAGTERKIVFWYDDDASYADDIDELQLEDGCKVLKLTGTNNFAAKLLLEKQDTEASYLVYAPFARPEDKENSLADIFYYSEHFYSDKLIQMMGDLNIPPECQHEVKKYKKFWSNGNVAKFAALGIGEYTPEIVDLGILCVLAGVKICSVEQLIRKTGYYTQCFNRWDRNCHIAKKDKVRCKNCEMQTYNPVNLSLIKAYMEGKDPNGNDVVAIYPMLEGNQCQLLVFDFDNHATVGTGIWKR